MEAETVFPSAHVRGYKKSKIQHRFFIKVAIAMSEYVSCSLKLNFYFGKRNQFSISGEQGFPLQIHHGDNTY